MHRFAPRPRFACYLLPPMLMIGGCTATMSNQIQQAANQVMNTSPGSSNQASAPLRATPQAQSRGTPRQKPVPLLTREDASIKALFAKGTVTGADLLPELRAFKRLSGDGKAIPIADLLGNSESAPESGGFLGQLMSSDLKSGLAGASMQLAVGKLESTLKATVMSTAVSELQGHLDFLIGDSKALQSETITLPSGDNLTAEQKQRSVTMAAIVVATRLSARMLNQATKDLKGLEQEYQTLIDRRERAAALLQQTLATGIPANAAHAFVEADLNHLRRLSASEGVAGFVKDMGAQTMALRLVAATDPKTYEDYKAQSDGLTKRQAAAMRTVAGVVAFGGLLTNFSSEFVKIGKQKSVAEILALGPLAAAFISEVPPVFQSAYQVATEGAGVLLKSHKHFKVTTLDKTVEVAGASEVFELIKLNGATPEFQSALFRDDGFGVLQRVHFCDAKAAIQMVDAAVPSQGQAEFAKEMALENPSQFSFVNVETIKADIVPELLGKDHRPRLNDRNPAMARVQQVVAGPSGLPATTAAAATAEPGPGYLKWNNEQVLRLVFANRDANAAKYAAMEFNGVTVRPVPSMQSLFAYESLADACRQQSVPVIAPSEPNQPPKPQRRQPAQNSRKS
ncbi:hypothetical protein [Sphaerotilus mobilis]|uniref:Uncharacterized protein n=1 Tax=Sphaerotilus mobilis TaxID=47994 RepID=A0A4Q7LRU5_9BURK|nr:hypothetical protein [Sphaerotilus mobilis]RZS57123.1 hypothetical protein EV685_1687 [Sphaerotilus mobilis]